MQGFCVHCGNALAGQQTRFCSKKCRDRANPIHTVEHADIPNSNKGTIGELAVAIDLLQRGYDVFRSISPTAKCDLVAVKDDISLRIEVKMGRPGRAGGIYIPSTDGRRFDILAVYLGADQITYIPPLADIANSPQNFVTTRDMADSATPAPPVVQSDQRDEIVAKARVSDLADKLMKVPPRNV